MWPHDHNSKQQPRPRHSNVAVKRRILRMMPIIIISLTRWASPILYNVSVCFMCKLQNSISKADKHGYNKELCKIPAGWSVSPLASRKFNYSKYVSVISKGFHIKFTWNLKWWLLLLPPPPSSSTFFVVVVAVAFIQSIFSDCVEMSWEWWELKSIGQSQTECRFISYLFNAAMHCGRAQK